MNRKKQQNLEKN